MSKVDDSLLEVKKELYSDPIIVEYFHLKELINKDEYLTKLDKSMREHQKKMCENITNDDVYLKEKAAYESCLNELKNNPLYINFENIKEEVLNLLNQVKDALKWLLLSLVQHV